jgi:hypothetical protein
MSGVKTFFSNTWKAYMSLDPWARSLIGVGVAVGTGFLAVKGYKALFPSDATKRNKEMTKNIDNEISQFRSQGIAQSYELSQYGIYANTCYEGMRYAVGDNYASVEETLKKMNTDLDVALLIKAFGFRQDYAFGLPTGEPKDLFTFVQGELGADWGGLTDYRVQNVNADWLKKGITYKI